MWCARAQVERALAAWRARARRTSWQRGRWPPSGPKYYQVNFLYCDFVFGCCFRSVLVSASLCVVRVLYVPEDGGPAPRGARRAHNSSANNFYNYFVDVM